jgi:trimethylamine--corrinoid protein Co-methyltransferase
VQSSRRKGNPQLATGEYKDEQASMDTVHAYSLELLRDTGIRFPNKKALALFKKHGFKVNGPMVHFEEQDIQKALKTVPSAFTIEARNPSRNIRIGENHFVMAPGYGTPFIMMWRHFVNWCRPQNF